MPALNVIHTECVNKDRISPHPPISIERRPVSHKEYLDSSLAVRDFRLILSIAMGSAGLSS